MNLKTIKLIPFLLLVLPAMVRAQFDYTISNGSVTITKCTGGGAVTVPNTIDGYPVTSIADDAFYFCTGMTSLTIGTNVTSIGEAAFEVCSSLTSVTIPNSVTSIGWEAFQDCSSLKSVTIPGSIGSIGADMFYNCSSLASVTIGNGITIIESEAFLECTSLTSITIPNSVNTIQVYAFSGDYSLASAFFMGYPPGRSIPVFEGNTTIYYLPGVSGWGSLFDGNPAFPLEFNFENSGSSLGVLTNSFGFNISGPSGLAVVTEACTNLSTHAWQAIQTNTITGGSTYFSDPQWSNFPARFYRLRWP